MSKWDRRMLGLVNLVATWSKDPSTGVGAVIVDSKNRIVSVGFNGFPRAVCDSDEALFDRDEKLRRTIHAEENALLFAGRSVEGCTIYVTHPPCAAPRPCFWKPASASSTWSPSNEQRRPTP